MAINKTTLYPMTSPMNYFALHIPIVLSFVLVYFGTLSWIAGTWSTYQGSHGPVILAISAYMIWTKRVLLRTMHTSANLPLGIATTVAGCLLLISGRLSSLLLLQYLSVIITLLGVVLLLWGTNYLKVLWYPIGYLVFMFPIFSEVLDVFSIYLQMAVASIAYHILNSAGITVFRHGVFLEFPSVALEVARECNGINHIMALVSLAIPLAYWTQESWVKRLFLITAAFPIGVIANGLRVTIIGLYGYYKPGGPTHGPYDLFYVSFIFFFGMFSLVALSSVLAGKKAKEPGKETQTPSVSAVHNYPMIQTFPLALGVAIFLLTGSYLYFFKPQPVYLAQPLEGFPYRVTNWTGEDVTFSDPPFSYFSADNELKRIYRNDKGREVKLYIGYFTSQEQNRELVHYRFDPLQRNARKITVDTRSGVITIRMSASDERSKKRTIYFWYDINGRVLTGRYAAKAATIMDAVVHRRTNGAIVVIAADMPDKEEFTAEFIRDTFPVMQTYLRR